MKHIVIGLFCFSLLQAQIKEVKIGQQVWTAENLHVFNFRNGDPIPIVKSNEEWQKAGENKQAAWCYFDNDSSNGTKYGKLYNWYAVNDPRGLAPKGWHIPSDQEWTDLTNYLGGKEQVGAKMKSKKGWNENGNGTNSSGFSGLPGGLRSSYGAFDVIGYYGYWWSSTKHDTFFAWNRSLRYYSLVMYAEVSTLREDGFSVRCLRDSR